MEDNIFHGSMLEDEDDDDDEDVVVESQRPRGKTLRRTIHDTDDEREENKQHDGDDDDDDNDDGADDAYDDGEKVVGRIEINENTCHDHDGMSEDEETNENDLDDNDSDKEKDEDYVPPEEQLSKKKKKKKKTEGSFNILQEVLRQSEVIEGSLLTSSVDQRALDSIDMDIDPSDMEPHEPGFKKRKLKARKDAVQGFHAAGSRDVTCFKNVVLSSSYIKDTLQNVLKGWTPSVAFMVSTTWSLGKE